MYVYTKIFQPLKFHNLPKTYFGENHLHFVPQSPDTSENYTITLSGRWSWAASQTDHIFQQWGSRL